MKRLGIQGTTSSRYKEVVFLKRLGIQGTTRSRYKEVVYRGQQDQDTRGSYFETFRYTGDNRIKIQGGRILKRLGIQGTTGSRYKEVVF